MLWKEEAQHCEELFRLELDANYERGLIRLSLVSLRYTVVNVVYPIVDIDSYSLERLLDILVEEETQSHINDSIQLTHELYLDYLETGDGGLFLEEISSLGFNGDSTRVRLKDGLILSRRVIEFVGLIDNKNNKLNVELAVSGNRVETRDFSLSEFRDVEFKDLLVVLVGDGHTGIIKAAISNSYYEYVKYLSDFIENTPAGNYPNVQERWK